MCTPMTIDAPNINLPGAKLPDGTPINGGVALPETNDTGGTNATPTTPDNAGLTSATAGTGDKVNAGDGKTTTDTPTGMDTPGSKTGGTTPTADPITDQNTLLINSLTTLAHQFTDTTAGILAGQKDAANALTNGFLNLSAQQQQALDAANELRKNTGQAARKPSYSLSTAKTQRANAGGAASTMLTGPTGVPTNQLALGRAQLLGGAPA